MLAAVGGEAFLRSILGVAAHLRVPKAVSATTLAAFATSSPELTVSTIAAAFQVNIYVIGVLVVAIGTSLPELVTMLLARLRGHDDVGVRTLIGSNLFNGLAIVGVAASIDPIAAPLDEIVVTLICGVAGLLLLPNRAGRISLGRAILLRGLYGGFVLATLVASNQPRYANWCCG